MARQHSTPVLLPHSGLAGLPLTPLAFEATGSGVSEADIQALVQAHPEILPIEEIDPIFLNPVPICTELKTQAGYIDNFMITPSGLPVLVECKLWRNPEGRREVVGQILDYAKELSLWSSSDLQREVNRRLKTSGKGLIEAVRAADLNFDEIHFHDTLTRNLRQGRFLLLIVGDGIREGVEAIAEYLHRHAGLHFSFGLVELPIYQMPDGGHLVVPRVLARTHVITRHVVSLPDGYREVESLSNTDDGLEGIEPNATSEERLAFWTAFNARLKLDDPEQPIPKPPKLGYTSFMLPVPSGNSWLTVYRVMKTGEVGVFLSSTRDTLGEQAMIAVAEDWQAIQSEIGEARLTTRNGRNSIATSRMFGDLNKPETRAAALDWLAEQTNAFVNACRPRIRSFVADQKALDQVPV